MRDIPRTSALVALTVGASDCWGNIDIVAMDVVVADIVVVDIVVVDMVLVDTLFDIAARCNAIASDAFVWRNVASANDLVLLAQLVLLHLQTLNFLCFLGLLRSNLIEVLLLDSLLLDSLLLLLELESNLFSLNFLQLGLNISIVDFTFLRRLDLLQE